MSCNQCEQAAGEGARCFPAGGRGAGPEVELAAFLA